MPTCDVPAFVTVTMVCSVTVVLVMTSSSPHPGVPVVPPSSVAIVTITTSVLKAGKSCPSSELVGRRVTRTTIKASDVNVAATKSLSLTPSVSSVHLDVKVNRVSELVTHQLAV